MGNEKSKVNFRKTFTQLLEKTQPVDINDNDFWNQFWNEYDTTIHDVFALIGSDEIKTLREESPNNIVTFCYKAVEKINALSELPKFTGKDKDIALNCVRILTRLLPFLFEDKEWRSFFWSSVPSQPDPSGEQIENAPLAFTLMSSLTDLLFFPDFTVSSVKPGTGKTWSVFCSSRDNPEDVANSKVIDSCEYIWQPGVGFNAKVQHSPAFDKHRTEILRLILTCFSETIYLESYDSTSVHENLWIKYFTGMDNRHALPLFTSLLNTIFSYDPIGYGVPYNHLMFNDSKSPLMEVALQILCVSLENLDEIHMKSSTSGVAITAASSGTHRKSDSAQKIHQEMAPSNTRLTHLHSMSTDSDSKDGPHIGTDNLFLHYMSRIHRDEDFAFILNGFIKLLNNPLIQTYLPGSTKKIQTHQELLILLWRMCDINRRFLFYLLKSSHILELLVPILYYLNDSRGDQSKIGLVHMGVFILLMLSGERNFGVRLNKPYDNRVSMDIPVFTGTHADLLIIVFHKIITTGHHLLQPLFDCLLTVIVNISPYLKSLSMVTANKLLHLLEAFTSPWFLLSSSTNHHLVFFLLEIINNIVQYQFDGNSNLIYCIIRKRLVFFNLINFKTDQESIEKIIKTRSKTTPTKRPSVLQKVEPENTDSNLKTTLKDTPALAIMTSDYRRNITSDQIDGTVTTSSSIDNNNKPLTTSTSQSSNQEEVSADFSPNSTHSLDGNSCDVPVVTSPTSTAANSPSSETASSQLPEPVQPCNNNITALSSETVAASNPQQQHHLPWKPTTKWVQSWKQKLPLQTIMRLLQVLVPQVEKLCIEKGLTDESEILKFLQRGTLVGLLPVPHPILIRKYQANLGTNIWFRTYMWGVIYLRNIDPPIWYDTNVQLFEIQRVSDS